MKIVSLILLIIALAIPVSASSVISWTQKDIDGYNLTLNYTSEFNVVKDDILNITIRNIGNGSEKDTITVNRIRVIDPSEADGIWTGLEIIEPNTSKTIDFELYIDTDDEETVNIRLYYTVNDEDKTLNIKAKYPGTPESAEIRPYITSWGNNKTLNGNLNITINQSETVRFNFTANQTLTSWRWTLNGESINNPSDSLSRKFNKDGIYKLRASGSNDNGTTQTILWKVTVKGTDEREEDDHNKINDDIISWYPQVVDYIYVNDTISETIEYSITTADTLDEVRWTEDGTVVNGYHTDNTYNYSRTWDAGNLGFHTIAFKGTDDTDNEVEFRWYVNVNEINGLRGGNWFDVIDYSNVKIKMFKYKTAKYGSNSENTLTFVNRLHNSIASRQMTREALRDAFKSGNLSVSEYVEALKQIQSNIKDDLKIAKRMNDIKKGIEKEDEEDDQENNYQSDRVKQNKINKKESKEDKKKDSSFTRNSNGNKEGNNNDGNNMKSRKDDYYDD